MAAITEANLIQNMSQAYNSHFSKNANAGEALVHMMEISKMDHPNLRNINPNDVLVTLSRGLNLSSRERLRAFACEVIVYLMKNVVGSKLPEAELIAMTEARVRA
ncbi:hypothetical protein G6712_00650 [Polynucleobacter paneuropaeus]|uniref:hypothetical protein n=1 Tax=Polynucleobacter paludilacus TaxID=1855895 RepID=UPI001BFED470|nr:hypothetical protein [Polynucleobacter paludilacus]MBT8557483.1 hypothetical protein [Polynucleobacter paneuropaeus]QWC97809.1 hypothetical protein G6729_05220 [Polynucleobacter paneuropaeus]QWD04883.1 hypothetical protein G6720_05430 [Polynucleobacter paneuropaeus]QWD06661.1 hypothetical protein G6719_05160 [Polynucleobacter paneuropaeus]QWD45121.1 hypothetical protein G6661_05225 [Polynucleobacter paneuropaeus]